jgi:hypothetical protein
MKELLDEHLHEEEQKSPRWYEKYTFYIYRKLYRNTYIVAGCMLLLLFFRDTLHINEFLGCDLDAVLALFVLCGVMGNLFYKILQGFFAGFVIGVILFFGVFLNYAPSVVATLHNTNTLYVTHWKWSHYELVFMGERSLLMTIAECTEWLLLYILLTAITAEILGFVETSIHSQLTHKTKIF